MFEAATAICLRGDLLSEVAVVDVDPLSDWVTVIEFFPQGSSERDFSRATKVLCDRLGWSSVRSTVRVVPVFGLAGESGRQLHIARVLELNRGTIVGIHRLADLPTPWPSSAPTMGKRSIVSIAIRCMREARRAGDTPAIGRAVAEELVTEVTTLLDEQMDSVVAVVAEAALVDGGQSPSGRLSSFQTLVETRIRVQRARTASRREGVEDSLVAQLDSVIGGLDSTASALAGMASTVLGETFARAEAAERARDRRITLIASALLLPALFFALLGINWIPTRGLQEWWVFFVVLAVGSGLGCTGWWLGKLVLGRAQEPTRANGSELHNVKKRRKSWKF